METSSTLLVRVRDHGDAAGWREFVAVYEPLIVAYACKQGLAEPAARDAAQEGRRIATVRRSAGLAVPVALMTPP